MSTDLTVFTCPKPFTGEFERIQTNALRSWQMIGVEIILTNAEPDTSGYALEYNTGLIQQFKRNEYGTPLLDDIFIGAEAICSTDLIAFVNTDMILFEDFRQAVAVCAETLSDFMLVGQRTNLTLTPLPCFNTRTAKGFRHAAETRGSREGIGASDYFVWRKGALGAVPPFALGRWRWDNWLMWHARAQGMALVDATEAVLAVHQNHAPTPRVEGDAEREYNDWLVSTNGGILGRLTDATHTLTADFELVARA